MNVARIVNVTYEVVRPLTDVGRRQLVGLGVER